MTLHALQAYVCDAIRTPFGRYGGALSGVRADDLGAMPLRALMQRQPLVDWSALDEVVYGCANQAGEDNRNVARMSALLAGLPPSVAGVTVNRLCGSGLEAVGSAARMIKTGEAQLVMAGGVESMSRAPFVVPKANTAYGRQQTMFDTTMGWRLVNPVLQSVYGTESMPQTAENIASDFGISRQAQDLAALSSQEKALAAQQAGHLAHEICPVEVPQAKGIALTIEVDEHPRATSLQQLTQLPGIVHPEGTVTAGNASGLNDGACALLLANDEAVRQHGLEPRARIMGMATAGVLPRTMGMGPVPAAQKLLARCGLEWTDMDVIELNEAFAAQLLAVLRQWGLRDDDARVNAWGGAIALGHPLGASGARLVTTAVNRLHSTGGRYALCAMCIGVGQGIALLLERV